MSDFDQIVEGLEIEEPDDLPDWSLLRKVELMDKVHELRKDLLDRGVALLPETPEDMEEQTVYLGLLEEMRRRGML